MGGGEKKRSQTSETLCDSELTKSWTTKGLLTVQTHVMEGEDSRSTAGSRAMEGHVQNTVWSLNTVLLKREAQRLLL